MPRPDCPRCGSDLVAAARPGAPSESVLELRGGNVSVGPVGGGFVHWLCRSCGHEWDPAAYPDRWMPESSDPPPDPTEVLTGIEGAPEYPENLATIEPAPNNPAAALRRTREEGGRTLLEASSGTRIQERHLRALESDAPLEEFPAPAYARFFLREYAEYLRLDPEPLLREFEARHPVVEEPPLEPLADKRGRPKVGWGVLIVLSAVAVILIALLPPTFRPDEKETPPPSVAAAPAHDSGHDQVPDPFGRQPSGVRAVLHLSQRSWVEAVADGELLEASTLEPGAAVVYRARDLLELTLGNAGGVRLRVNGELVPTGGSGDVVSLDLRWQDGAVLTDRG